VKKYRKGGADALAKEILPSIDNDRRVPNPLQRPP